MAPIEMTASAQLVRLSGLAIPKSIIKNHVSIPFQKRSLIRTGTHVVERCRLGCAFDCREMRLELDEEVKEAVKVRGKLEFFENGIAEQARLDVPRRLVEHQNMQQKRKMNRTAPTKQKVRSFAVN